jgi:DNA-binding transcriptional regulator YiaG
MFHLHSCAHWVQRKAIAQSATKQRTFHVLRRFVLHKGCNKFLSKVGAVIFGRMEWTPENIRLLRMHLGETQEKFARRVGLGRRQTVHNWEKGIRKPSGPARKLLGTIADDAGFTKNVAAQLKRQIELDREGDAEEDC